MQQQEEDRNDAAVRARRDRYCRHPMRPAWGSLLFGVALGAMFAAAAAGLRAPFAVAAEEALAHDTAAIARWSDAFAYAVVASAAVALALRFSPLGKAAGSFGSCVAICAAAGCVTVAAGLPLGHAMFAGVAAFAAAGCALVAPLLRERGVLSLAIGGAVLALPHLVAIRAANGLARSSAPLRTVRDAIAGSAAPLHGLLLGDGVDEQLAMAIGIATQSPFADVSLPLVAARSDSLAGSMLRRLPVALFELAGDRCAPVAGASEALRRIDGIERAAAAGGAPFSVRWPRAMREQGAQCIVLTPYGAVDGPFGADGVSVFPPADDARLGRWLAAMPSGAPILVVAIPPSAADPPGWVSFVQ